MSWLAEPGVAGASFEELLRLRPVLADAYERYVALVVAAAPARLAELCSARMAQLHECGGDWEIPAVLDDEERAALVLTEKLAFRVHDVTDDDLAALRRSLTDAEVVALVSAIALFDVLCRLRIFFDVD